MHLEQPKKRGLDRFDPHFFGCSKWILSWDNFYVFAVASMVPKIAKKPIWIGPANTNLLFKPRTWQQATQPVLESEGNDSEGLDWKVYCMPVCTSWFQKGSTTFLSVLKFKVGACIRIDRNGRIIPKSWLIRKMAIGIWADSKDCHPSIKGKRPFGCAVVHWDVAEEFFIFLR